MKNAVAVTALIWAMGLSIASLAIPPTGVIDGSVLILIAQIIVFIATVMGITLPSSIFKSLNGSKTDKKI